MTIKRHNIHIRNDLWEIAAKEAALEKRSIVKQIEYWVVLGRNAAASHLNRQLSDNCEDEAGAK